MENSLVDDLNDSLSQLCGTILTSVEFVLDYLVLKFEGPTLTTYTRPSVSVGGKTLSWAQVGYRDAVCERIGVKVVSTNIVDNDELTIAFADEARFRVSLRSEDYRGIEAVYFTRGTGGFWVI
jgi:hypothetical protein